MKFSIKYFLSKCDQIRSFLQIWSHWLKKSLMENFIFCAVTALWEKFWARYCTVHCVKSTRIRSFSGLHFPSFGLNTESISPYSVRIWENTDQKTPNMDTFHAVIYGNVLLEITSIMVILFMIKILIILFTRKLNPWDRTQLQL